MIQKWLHFSTVTTTTFHSCLAGLTFCRSLVVRVRPGPKGWQSSCPSRHPINSTNSVSALKEGHLHTGNESRSMTIMSDSGHRMNSQIIFIGVPATSSQSGSVCVARVHSYDCRDVCKRGTQRSGSQWLHHGPQLTILVSGEAILSAENSGKPLGSRGSISNPAEGAHSAPPEP